MADPIVPVAITVTTAVGPYPPSTITANLLDVAYTTGDATNGHYFPCTGRELLIARNSSGGALTITVSSQYDAANRKADITTYSIGASEIAMFWFGQTTGWADSSGNVNLTVSAADILLAVVRIP